MQISQNFYKICMRVLMEYGSENDFTGSVENETGVKYQVESDSRWSSVSNERAGLGQGKPRRNEPGSSVKWQTFTQSQ